MSENHRDPRDYKVSFDELDLDQVRDAIETATNEIADREAYSSIGEVILAAPALLAETRRLQREVARHCSTLSALTTAVIHGDMSDRTRREIWDLIDE